MSGLINSMHKSFHTSSTTVTEVKTPPPTEEERELIRLNTKLAQRQLANIDQLAPFQKELLEASLADIRRESASSAAFDKAISPEDQAAFAKEEFDRARKFGPIQDQLLQAQLDAMQGKISPEQKAAMDAAIEAGGADIDLATEKGIGLISDELANARGLRLTDTPILREATLLAQSGQEQKASLSKNIRATGMLQFPQIASGIGLSQQNLASATQAFQADLRQRAFQNRLALTGQTSTSGIGLASVGGGAGASALHSLSGVRAKSGRTTFFDPNALLKAFGGGSQIGSQMISSSDRRLKTDIERIGKLPSGIPVYKFKFIGRDEERVGVMADEVLKVIPSAVSKDERGYYMVNYGMLR